MFGLSVLALISLCPAGVQHRSIIVSMTLTEGELGVNNRTLIQFARLEHRNKFRSL